MSAHPAVSIVIPAYNQSQRIQAALSEVLRVIWQYRWDAEVIVVDDDSADNTAELVEAVMATNPKIKLVQNFRYRGEYLSVREGMLHAQGEIVLVTDADLSVPIDEGRSLFDAIQVQQFIEGVEQMPFSRRA